MNPVYSSRLSKALFVSAGLLVSGGFAYGQALNLQIEIEQVVELDTFPVSVLVIGSNAQVHNDINVIKDDVYIAGNLRLKAKLDTAPVSALAICSDCEASSHVNAIVGR